MDTDSQFSLALMHSRDYILEPLYRSAELCNYRIHGVIDSRTFSREMRALDKEARSRLAAANGNSQPMQSSRRNGRSRKRDADIEPI